MAQQGNIQRLNYKIPFLRTFPYIHDDGEADFIGIHMSGVKLPKRKAIWNGFFGPSNQNDSKLILSEKDLKPSKAQIEMENHILDENVDNT